MHPQLKQLTSKGTYILHYTCAHNTTKQIGKLGTIQFLRGNYFYIGSAFGPGGIGARISHHVKKDKTKLHWHADYLTAFMKPVGFYYIIDQKVEHE